MRISTFRAVLAALVLGALALPQAAQAWSPHHRHHGWYGGYYVAPPVYVAPQPYYYSPPPATSGGCYAGPYVCPLQGPAYAGQSCACDTAQGRVWGHAR